MNFIKMLSNKIPFCKNAQQQRLIANNGQLTENCYFRDQLLKQLIRQIRILTPATCDSRDRYLQAHKNSEKKKTDQNLLI